MALGMEGHKPLQPVLSAGFVVIGRGLGRGRQKRESTEEQQPDIYSLRNPYAKGMSSHNVAEVTVGR